MTNQEEVTKIEVFTLVDNVEKLLIDIVNQSVPSIEALDSKAVFKELITKDTMVPFTLISVTFKIFSDKENSFLAMDLLTLVKILLVRECTSFSDLLIKAAYSKLPNLMAAIGDLYGSSSLNTDSIGDIEDTSVTSNGSNEHNIGDSGGTVSLDCDTKLINDHWNYIGDLVQVISDGNEEFTFNSLEFMYKTAFAHGWKHYAESILESK